MDALPKDINSLEATIPSQAIGYINKLFEIEKKLEIFSPEGRKEQRLIQEKPVLDAFWSWSKTTATEYFRNRSLVRHFNMLQIRKKV